MTYTICINYLDQLSLHNVGDIQITLIRLWQNSKKILKIIRRIRPVVNTPREPRFIMPNKYENPVTLILTGFIMEVMACYMQ